MKFSEMKFLNFDFKIYVNFRDINRDALLSFITVY